MASEYDEYVARIANDVGEATVLIESGFHYVTGEYDDGGKIFRRRKIDDYVEAGSTPQKHVSGAGSSVV